MQSILLSLSSCGSAGESVLPYFLSVKHGWSAEVPVPAQTGTNHDEKVVL